MTREHLQKQQIVLIQKIIASMSCLAENMRVAHNEAKDLECVESSFIPSLRSLNDQLEKLLEAKHCDRRCTSEEEG